MEVEGEEMLGWDSATFMLKNFSQNQSFQIQKYELNGLAMKLCIPANLAFRSPHAYSVCHGERGGKGGFFMEDEDRG